MTFSLGASLLIPFGAVVWWSRSCNYNNNNNFVCVNTSGANNNNNANNSRALAPDFATFLKKGAKSNVVAFK